MIGNRIRRPLKLAIEVARKANHNLSWHLGSILMNGKEIVSIGFNRDHTHPKSNSQYRYLHAEADAIIGTPQHKLDGGTLFVARVGFEYRKEIMLAKPCLFCQTAIIRANIRMVYYTISSNMIGIWDVRNDEHRTEYVMGIQ